ncbi:AraC family transcriptional regulator [Moraxella nasibovis]|uniref:AraC family transcriptional regulator n=1 Tax=Moraxella nasibovis TaxID=2904120 RepID=UPI00240F313C|nr:AraC family transcriptional regulator [Moraxella nasibovis]WFF39109.1 AraC family transcriptional regulator [Moraxella nasibovis]
MDILDSLLTFAQLNAGVHINCQLSGEWALPNPHKQGQAVAHIVLKGKAYLTLDDKNILLKQGDIAFFAQMHPHLLSNLPNQSSVVSATPNLSEQGGFVVNKIGQGESECELLCLHFHYDSHSELLASLPPVISVALDTPSLAPLITLLKHETTAPALASKTAVNALSLMLFVLILRQYFARTSDSFLANYQHPRLMPLIQAIMTAPEKSWYINEMAEFANVSRSQLIRLFNQHLGISPHAFLHKIRLQKSAMLLKQSNHSVLYVALSLGFGSETHFSRAFKKQYGVTPSGYRG